MEHSNKNDKVEKSNKHEHFLLKEYDYYANCFWKSEEKGEKRLNFFISLVTAVLTASIAIFTFIPTFEGAFNFSIFIILIFIILIALFSFGLTTLKRIVKRNLDSDLYKSHLDEIRGIFQNIYKTELEYYKFYKNVPPREISTGGIANIISFLNSIIGTACFISLISLYQSIISLFISAPLIFFMIYIWQYAYLASRYYKGYFDRKAKGYEKEGFIKSLSKLLNKWKLDIKVEKIKAFEETKKSNQTLIGIFLISTFLIINICNLLFYISAFSLGLIIINCILMIFGPIKFVFWIYVYIKIRKSYKKFRHVNET